jgi:hypothetical protein
LGGRLPFGLAGWRVSESSPNQNPGRAGAVGANWIGLYIWEAAPDGTAAAGPFLGMRTPGRSFRYLQLLHILVMNRQGCNDALHDIQCRIQMFSFGRE